MSKKSKFKKDSPKKNKADVRSVSLTEDINMALTALRKLQEIATTPTLPPKNKKLWAEAKKEAEDPKKDKQIIDKLKRRAAQRLFPPGDYSPPFLEKQKLSQEERQAAILANAEIIYEAKDPAYAKAKREAKRKAKEATPKALKDVDHALYAIKDGLLAFDRAKGTLLLKNWKALRADCVIVNEIESLHPLLEVAIDDLEAIRDRVEVREKAALKEKPEEKGQKTSDMAGGTDDEGKKEKPIILNLVDRTLTIGEQTKLITSESAWSFLKTLADNKRMGQLTPRKNETNDWKNACDTLRRFIEKGSELSENGFMLEKGFLHRIVRS